jgi:hypothetical protein
VDCVFCIFTSSAFDFCFVWCGFGVRAVVRFGFLFACFVLKRVSVDQVPLKAQTSRHLGHKEGGENRGLALVHTKTLGVTFKGDHTLSDIS